MLQEKRRPMAAVFFVCSAAAEAAHSTVAGNSFSGSGRASTTSSPSLHVDHDAAAGDQLAEQQLVGQRTLDLVLHHARHRPRAHLRIEAVLGQPLRAPPASPTG